MTREEAIEILQEEHNYVQEPCYVMNAIKKAIEALQAAEKYDHNAAEMRPNFISDHSGGTNKMVDHVAEVGNMAPLTLEQLRQMDGKPAWIVPVGDEDWKPHWEVMKYRRFSADSKTERGKMYFLYEDSYGLRWLAYDYPPAHIDLEAWKECPWCKAEYTIIDDDFGQPVHPNMVKFCWSCGRPLTPEARAMLEKRLRGVRDMSLEYPCVYHKNGWCYKDQEQPDACVYGPCDDETPSNGDKVRRMTDEELARFLASVEYRRSAAGGGALWCGAAHALEWLRQPAKED